MKRVFGETFPANPKAEEAKALTMLAADLQARGTPLKIAMTIPGSDGMALMSTGDGTPCHDDARDTALQRPALVATIGGHVYGGGNPSGSSPGATTGPSGQSIFVTPLLGRSFQGNLGYKGAATEGLFDGAGGLGDHGASGTLELPPAPVPEYEDPGAEAVAHDGGGNSNGSAGGGGGYTGGPPAPAAFASDVLEESLVIPAEAAGQRLVICTSIGVIVYPAVWQSDQYDVITLNGSGRNLLSRMTGSQMTVTGPTTNLTPTIETLDAETAAEVSESDASADRLCSPVVTADGVTGAVVRWMGTSLVIDGDAEFRVSVIENLDTTPTFGADLLLGSFCAPKTRMIAITAGGDVLAVANNPEV